MKFVSENPYEEFLIKTGRHMYALQEKDSVFAQVARASWNNALEFAKDELTTAFHPTQDVKYWDVLAALEDGKVK
jgi:hypothetical protein